MSEINFLEMDDAEIAKMSSPPSVAAVAAPAEDTSALPANDGVLGEVVDTATPAAGAVTEELGADGKPVAKVVEGQPELDADGKPVVATPAPAATEGQPTL